MKKTKLIFIIIVLTLNCQLNAQITITHIYDNLSRLDRTNYNNGISIQYTYDALGNRTSHVISGNTCNPAIPITTNLSSSICNTDSMLFNGIYRKIAGVYKDTVTSYKYCDSFINLTLSIKNASSSSLTQTACSSFLWSGTTYTSSGVYVNHYTNAVGCDSTATLYLTINIPSSKSWTQTICASDSFYFKGKYRKTSGIYKDTLINTKGCDSFITLTLVVNPTHTNSLTISACSSYSFGDSTYTSSGTYTKHFTNIYGCDSLVTLVLTIKSTSSYSYNQTICNTDSFFFNGIYLKLAGIYKNTLVNAKGCDSFLTLNLTIKNTSSSSLTQTACSSYLWAGTTYTSSGVYLNHYTNSVGCDSTVTLNLTINSPSSKSWTQTICASDSFYFKGKYRKTSGIYKDTLLNAKGCDSFITLTLVVNPTHVNSLTISACSSYNFGDSTYTSSGTYTKHFTNIYGCDSMVILYLTLKQASSYSYSLTICNNDSIYFKGKYIKFPGIYLDTLINAKGCDSFVSLTLKNKYLTMSTTIISVCDSIKWNGKTYNTSGIYGTVLTNAAGCDSIATLIVTVYKSYNKQITKKICSTDSFYFKSKYWKHTVIISDSFKTINNCDSITTLNLTVLSDTVIINDTICLGDTVKIGNLKYYETGNYLIPLKNILGCDSVIKLNLYVITIIKPFIQKQGTNLVILPIYNFYQWKVNGFNITLNGNSNIYAPTLNGNYTVLVGNNYCNILSDSFILNTLSIINNNSSIKLYPNPTKNNFTIDIDKIEENIKLEVYNSIGQLIYKSKISTKISLINCEHWAVDTYNILIINKKAVNSFKLIKE